MNDSPKRFDTLAVHGIAAPEVPGRPIVAPIVQTSTFVHEDADSLAASLLQPDSGFSYTRLGNPTLESLARTVAALEGAETGLVFGSGMAAIHAALVGLCSAGDHVVCASAVYGGTFSLLSHGLARLGVESVFVDVRDVTAVESAITSRTRLIYAETVANPTLVVADLARLAAVAHAAGALMVVDNTFATPYLCRPIAELGADLVLHSATKYLGGHGDLIAGVVVGAARHLEPLRLVQADVGGVASPFTAWLVLRGLKTLVVRVARQCRSAGVIADALASHPSVDRVVYPGLSSHPDHEIAARQLRAGHFGGMICLEVKGGREAGRRFQDRLQLVARAGSLGDVHSLALHPASTTHRQLDAAALREARIGESMVRISVGLEDPEDLLADLRQALATPAA